MIIYCDIDGVLFKQKTNYYDIEPIKSNIDKLNKLYDEGNTIILYSNRGGITGIDWRELTESQLKQYGIKYHKLTFDKPYYDVFIDDRAYNSFDDYEKSR